MRSFPFKENLTLTHFNGIISNLCLCLVFMKNTFYLFSFISLFPVLSFILLMLELNNGPTKMRWWLKTVRRHMRAYGYTKRKRWVGWLRLPEKARTSTFCYCFSSKPKHEDWFAISVEQSRFASNVFFGVDKNQRMITRVGIRNALQSTSKPSSFFHLSWCSSPHSPNRYQVQPMDGKHLK